MIVVSRVLDVKMVLVHLVTVMVNVGLSVPFRETVASLPESVPVFVRDCVNVAEGLAGGAVTLTDTVLDTLAVTEWLCDLSSENETVTVIVARSEEEKELDKVSFAVTDFEAEIDHVSSCENVRLSVTDSDGDDTAVSVASGGDVV